MSGTDSLRPFFRPRSVAVIGASRNPAKLGHRVLRSLIAADFEGPVFPVNPVAEHVASVKSYPSVDQIPDPVELAVVAVPAPQVAGILAECGEKGVEAAVIITAGFAESGEEGGRRQQEVLEVARRYGIRVVGPNCLGVASPGSEVRLNATFAPQAPPAGRAALCSQSGALGVAIIAQARRVSLGLSAFVSVGNKADVDDDDLLEYWGEHDGTDVILFYLESFSDPHRLGRIARRVSRSKPVIVVKSGRTEAGERAVGSHTASLTGSDSAVDAFFDQTGMIRAGSLREMFDLARFLTLQPVPAGRRVGVVSNAGGPAILCVDALERSGLEVPALSSGIREALSEFLPPEAGLSNPVDMIASASPDDYRKTIEIVLGSGEVDALVVIYTPVGLHVGEAMQGAIVESVEKARARGSADVPVLASFIGASEYVHVLEGEGETIPAYPFPEEMGRVLRRAVAHREWAEADPGGFPDFPDQDFDRVRRICAQAVDERGKGWLTAEETRGVLEAAGLRGAHSRVARTEDEAAEAAAAIGFPVAVKLTSSSVVHKTELGMVRLGLEGTEDVREAFREIRETMEREASLEEMDGVLIQPMLEGTEVMIGMDPDPVFGPVLAFGLGGVHVEVLRDVAFRVAPLTDRDAREMIRETRGYTLLTGYRDHAEGDVEALEEALLRLSRLVEEVPCIGQLDLNPVFAMTPGHGYRIADARIEVDVP
ncbi:MAG: acetate--CoA ligase family protein [Longimicrobiales bacterium]|nr:acetate--CoA ligase family protein [Longimicrobiales bacterium]